MNNKKKWILGVIVSIVVLLLVFYLISLRFEGDYGKAGVIVGAILGSLLAFQLIYWLQLRTTDGLVNKLIYPCLGSNKCTRNKILYSLILIPFISVICAGMYGYWGIICFSMGYSIGDPRRV